jgi:hypothetical protein
MRRVTAFLVVLSVCGLTAEASAAISTPAGLNPGDHFRIVFVTSTGTTATSPNIADYDLFVSNLANAAGLDTYLNDPLVTWQAIGSTLSATNPTGVAANGAGRLPVSASPVSFVLLDGTKVALSTADLWDGSILNAIDTTEFGNTLQDNVWTGSTYDGYEYTSPLSNALGSSSPIIGFSFQIGSSWASSFLSSASSVLPLYGVSQELVVPGTVPEPASIVLWGVLACCGVACARLRRRTTDSRGR